MVPLSHVARPSLPALFSPLASRATTAAAPAAPLSSAAASAVRLWLDFVNTERDPTTTSDTQSGARPAAGAGEPWTRDQLADFTGLVAWLRAAGTIDAARATGLVRRAAEQPAGAHVALADVRRVRRALRALAENGATSERARHDALAEINRVLGRSACHRRVEPRHDGGGYVCNLVAVGDAFSGLLIPVIESAAASLVAAELGRVHRCADARCPRVFYDATRNGVRRWCDMSRCGNRAKAARHRQKLGTGARSSNGAHSTPLS